MERALRIVDVVAPAQGIEAVLLPWVEAPGKKSRESVISQNAAVFSGPWLRRRHSASRKPTSKGAL